jgi:PKD repeat protein
MAMILKRLSKKIRAALSRFYLILLYLLVICILPINLWAQNPAAVSNGAGILGGGNYSGYFSAGQQGTYLFANGNITATQGIILNDISSETEFTFVLSGNLTIAGAVNIKSGDMRLISPLSSLSGTPLSFADVFLVLVETGEIFAQTTTDENGYFTFAKVPYKNFYLTINPEIPENSVLLLFESNIFIQEVVVNGEVGTEGITASASIIPVNGCDPDHPDYRVWYPDFDGDGFGNNSVMVGLCYQPTGYSINNQDCNDIDPLVNPDAEDLPGSGIDGNCDGIISCGSLDIAALYGPSEAEKMNIEIEMQALIEDNTAESAIWEWGDGELSSGIVQKSSVTGTHIYREPGVYTVKLNITNGCGDQFSFSYNYVVIYDSSAGFVAGAGKISSPSGASTAYRNSNGMASFGFVSLYENNKKHSPKNPVFKLDNGGFNFVSTKSELLIVAGNSAKFKGSGEINGTGNYEFMISAEDGDLNRKKNPDKLHVRIWNKNSGETVFDNKTNSGKHGKPATEILEGSIVIHVPHPKSGAIVQSDQTEKTGSDLLTIYPNPSKGIVNIIQNISFDDQIDLKVFSSSGTLILEKSYKGRDSMVFDMSDQVPGLYLLYISIGNERFYKKLTVQ